jgi:hypothetical protein
MKVEHETERQSPRKVADRILTIRIEPDNHAIVLNVSDEGLGFHAYAPVTQSGTIHFSFSDNGRRFEGSGELIWTDATQKTGGLRFSSLSRASRQRIWNWLDQLGAVTSSEPSAEAATKQEETAHLSSAAARESVASVSRPTESSVPRQQVSSAPAVGAAHETIADAERFAEPGRTQTAQPPPVQAPYLGLGLPQNYGAPPPEGVPPAPPVSQPTLYPGFSLIKEDPRPTPYSWNDELEPPKTNFFSGFVSGGIVSAIIVAIVIFAYGNPIGFLLGKGQAWTTTPAASQREPAPPPPAGALARTPAPSTPISPGNVAAPSAPSSAADASGNSGATDSADSTLAADATTPTKQPAETETPAMPRSRQHLKSTRITRPPKTVADGGDGDFALAQRYLNGKAGRADGAIAAPFLWAAVEKGNVAAEVTLADLYARGDGVPKNCDQARVLFRAAAEKGSSEASQQLSQIIRRGCR